MEYKKESHRRLPFKKGKQKPELNLFPLDPSIPAYVLPQPYDYDKKRSYESKDDTKELVSMLKV